MKLEIPTKFPSFVGSAHERSAVVRCCCASQRASRCSTSSTVTSPPRARPILSGGARTCTCSWKTVAPKAFLKLKQKAGGLSSSSLSTTKWQRRPLERSEPLVLTSLESQRAPTKKLRQQVDGEIQIRMPKVVDRFRKFQNEGFLSR